MSESEKDMSKTIRYVADGPLIGNEGRWVGERFHLTPAGTVPVGTPLTLTGESVGVWVEGASPFLAARGLTRWWHSGFLSAERPGQEVEGAPVVGGLVSQAASALDRWVAASEGRRFDVDGKWGAQCVDLSKAWAFENGAPAGAYGNGVDVARGLSQLPGWRFAAPSEAPQPGWIGSWGKPYGVWRVRDAAGKLTGEEEFYGHTAVVIGRASGGRVPVLQQDGFDSATVAERASLPLDSVVGWAVPPTDPSTAVVTVQRGDTLGAIARRTGVDVSTLARINGLVDPNTIVVGQLIRTVEG